MPILERIKGLCEKKGISINRLEKESGVGRGAVARWDTHSPSAEKVAAVADYFGVTTDYILAGKQKETPPAEPRAADPVAQELYNMIGKMSRAELVLLLERAERIIESRG